METISNSPDGKAGLAQACSSSFEKLETQIFIKMRTKLILIFIGLVLIPVLIIGKISYDSERETIFREVSQGNLRVAEIIAQEVAQILLNTRSTLMTMALLEDFRNMRGDAVRLQTENLVKREKLKKNNLLKDFYVYDKKGNLVSATSGDPGLPVKRMWFMTAVKGSLFGFTSHTAIDPWSNEPRLYLGQVIRDDLYEVAGALIAELDLTYLQNVIKQIRVGQTGHAYIVDSFGRVIAHPNTSEILRRGIDSIASRNRAVALSLQGADSGVAEVVQAIGGPIEFVDHAGTAQLAAYTNLRKVDMDRVPNWGVIVQQQSSEAYISLNRIKRRVMLVMILCIIIASVVGVLIATSITVPIADLEAGACRIAGGDLDHPLKVRSSDEIGALTAHFDEMRQSLRDRMSEISTLYTIGQEMCSVLDYDRLLNLILDEMITALKAAKGSLMLFDEETRKMKIRVARGLSDDVVSSTEVSEGEGVAGMVLKLRRPILIRDCETDPELSTMKGGKVFSGSLMSVPLLVKDSMRGVVNISRIEANSFSEKDLRFLQGLAVQASIALENARLYKLAITDGMTKLYIHRYFQQRLDEEIKRTDRYGSELSLIMTDVDHFKNFNDSFGHQQGDRVLQSVAKIMRDSMREVDIVARYGGEEFAVICPEKSYEEILIPAERLRVAVENYDLEIAGKRVPITISIGIATYPTDAGDKKTLIERADQALYHAKETGRNRVCLYRQIPGKES
ncbi:MAG: hypothetical protein CVV64_03550 [Candidatus Wallbacteria bacterium HGW-Wallbacteria-1]|jgi:diguanylate cyclase (GGDEF)-like protein|uniref:Diguanylate cyclase n=1 Tax=Candidatus Wallbacteria bacterium HGW-Wallbacteria-1 TaxID=2013854 RepID=A0A2N1PTW0_9BACT|nr:MAG: hypothetical protein CVV64_03550 [Candidatus Wallbacteria bacterium HGW-Wallbacteria-1]